MADTHPEPVFVLGAPRSGTTLLRVMLEGHSRLFSPPEMVIAPYATMAERKEAMNERFWEKGGLRRALMELRGLDVDGAKAAEEQLIGKTTLEVYEHLQELLGVRILVDKCPHLSARPDALARLHEWFPRARYVWLVRHPGSVLRSIENMPYAEVMLKGYADDPREIWQIGNELIGRHLGGIPQDRWVRVKYEDLVVDARPGLQSICELLGLELEPAMLDPYEGDRMRDGPKGARAVGDPNMASRGTVQPELATSWLEGFDPESVSDATRELAGELGYDLAALKRPPITRVTANLGTLLRTAIDLEEKLSVPMDLDAVEGRRFLLRMLAASVDTFTEQGDTERPRFEHAEGPQRKMFADCPDADYLRAPIRLDGGAVYRVAGKIPAGTTYVGVVLYRRGGKVGRFLSDDALGVNDDGRFTLLLAAGDEAPEGEGVWVQGEGDETAVIVRQYFTDRSAQATIEIEIDKIGPLADPAPLEPAAFAKQLERSTRMLHSIVTRTVQAYQMVRVAAHNRFIEIPGDQLFPTPDNAYRVCWYRIGKDQVMLVRGKIPASRYFGLCLYNAWMESFDYTRHRINLNDSQIQTDADGRFEVCIAHDDPGHPNWLDCAGHDAGYLLARTLLPGDDGPQLETEILYLSEWKR